MRGFIGIDIETTGLDPESGHILEVAVVRFDHEMQEQGRVQLLCVDEQAVAKVAERDLDPFIINMHTESGLLAELDALEWDAQGSKESYQALLDIVASWHEALGGPQPMLGSSVHFDRAWLKVHMPELEALFSHRNIDASSLREYARVVDPEGLTEVEGTLKERATHRAKDDVLASAELVKVLGAHAWSAR